MNQLIDNIGTATGTAGVLVCTLAVVLRLGGQFYLLGTELRMWLLAGIALLAAGCFAKLHALAAERKT
ncbi:MAG: hypothetical protein RJQ10_03475 [Haliea sp.]|uniref:hypothetical protein n=1 Tax=Haliea sp. TaxID=1932666 RepID=UPI0032EEF162